MLDHYLHTAHAAARLLDPYLESIAMISPMPGVTLAEPATAEDALYWFITEHAGLLAAIQLATEAGFDTHTWQLAWTLTTFFLRRGHWHHQALAQNAGLDAARRIDDPVGQAHALHGLALGYARSGRFGEALPYFQHALRLFEQADDHASQAYVHSSLTWLAERQERPADALSHSLRAVDLHRASGYTHHQLGNYQRAVTCYQHALDLSRDLADRYNEADTLAHVSDLVIWRSTGRALWRRLGKAPRASRSPPPLLIMRRPSPSRSFVLASLRALLMVSAAIWICPMPVPTAP